MGLGGDGGVGVLGHNHVEPNSVELILDCFVVECGLQQYSVIISRIKTEGVRLT